MAPLPETVLLGAAFPSRQVEVGGGFSGCVCSEMRGLRRCQSLFRTSGGQGLGWIMASAPSRSPGMTERKML